MSEINVSEHAGVRYLHFSSDWIQGAMRIARPYALELDYTREMMLPLLLRSADWPRRILLVGLGAGSLTKFLWRYRPQAKLTVVEIDSRVEAMARQFFKLPDDPARICMHFADGADFMIHTKQRFDLILIDGFDADARAGRLDTLPFYLDCRTRLRDEGLLCVNLLSRRKDFGKSIARLEQAFDGHTLAFPSCASGNAIALATVGNSTVLSMGDLQQAAAVLKQDSGLDLRASLARLAESKRLSGDRLDF